MLHPLPTHPVVPDSKPGFVTRLAVAVWMQTSDKKSIDRPAYRINMLSGVSFTTRYNLLLFVLVARKNGSVLNRLLRFLHTPFLAKGRKIQEIKGILFIEPVVSEDIKVVDIHVAVIAVQIPGRGVGLQNYMANGRLGNGVCK